MITGNEFFHPLPITVDQHGNVFAQENYSSNNGITLHQYYAGLAMQGMLAACRGYDTNGLDNLAKCAVK